ncbi:MAG: tetratricopeptide repeat protein [Cyanobacteria bacterium P01_G01_bin.67]
MNKLIISFDKAVELEPNNVTALFYKSNALFYLKRYQEALKNIDKIIELNPNVAQFWHNRGVLLKKLNRHREAVDSFNKAIDLDAEEFYSRQQVIGFRSLKHLSNLYENINKYLTEFKKKFV